MNGTDAVAQASDSTRPAAPLRVCPLSALPPGSVQRVVGPAEPIMVCNVDGDILAVQDTCSHEDASLADGFLEGDEIECPLHGATFNVRTGDALCFPAEHPLRRYVTEVRDDVVFVVP